MEDACRGSGEGEDDEDEEEDDDEEELEEEIGPAGATAAADCELDRELDGELVARAWLALEDRLTRVHLLPLTVVICPDDMTCSQLTDQPHISE